MRRGRSLAPLVVALALGAAGSASAGAYVTCLQNQLAQLGHDPGSVDGLMGPATREAAAAFRQEAGLEEDPWFETISARHAISWCREIGQRYPALKKYRPSAEPADLRVSRRGETGWEPGLLRSGVQKSRAFFKDRFGIELASRVDVAAGSEAREVADHLAALRRKRGEGTKRAARELLRRCKDNSQWNAVAYDNQTYVCWPEPRGAADQDWWERMTPILTEILVHEHMHHVQKEYSLEKVTPGSARVMGPAWLVEGSAMMIEQLYREEAEDGFRSRTTLYDRLSRSRKAKTPLSRLTRIESTADYEVSDFAAYLLMKRHGIDTMFSYWALIGQGMSWEEAFQATFGIGLKDYEDQFETLRTDFNASIDFISQGEKVSAGPNADLSAPQKEAQAARIGETSGPAAGGAEPGANKTGGANVRKH